MTSQPRRIIIVGGGTAGWMAAACLSRFLGRGTAITLVESDAIGTVGVGEATIPQIRLFNQALGIDEADFLRATQGSIKLGIEFVGWRDGAADDRYMHAFGAIGRDLGLIGFHHYWLRARAQGADAGDLSAYSLNESAARAGRFQHGPARSSRQLPDMPYAYHFDAHLYAAFLRQRAEAQGVVRIEGRVTSVERDAASGDVAALLLDGDQRVAGDLFLDCSGFRGLLIEQALGSGYDDWSHWLPCNRAVAVPCARSGEPPLAWTRATARDAGWQWRIPLQHRTGNGYVYCDAYLGDDAAAAALLGALDGAAEADVRQLAFTTGKRRHVWHHNVVALGLASGFMEPLESTSIHLVQSAISRLLALLPRDPADPAIAAEFNRQTDFEYSRIRDFLILHYKATRRTDTPFWRDRAAMPIPDSLAARIDLFERQGLITRDQDELFTEVAWLQVLVGQGIGGAGWHPLADTLTDADLSDYLAMLRQLIAREVDQMPAYPAFLSSLAAKDAA